MLQFILSCLYFFLPAYFTNMTPPLAKNFEVLKTLAKPIDFNKKIGGEPILGSHKTWRGAVSGIFVGMLVAYFQSWLYQFSSIQKISLINYEKENILLFGFLMAGGTIFGDIVSAFFKRRLRLQPGAKFLPFDQTNYVIGTAVLFSLTPFFKINGLVWSTLFILTFFLHIIVNQLGYRLKLHKAKW